MDAIDPHRRETELKLLLEDAAAIDRLIAELGPELPALIQHNVYYDGPHGEWSGAGLAVRMRVEDDRHLLTVKSAGQVHGDFVERAEFERTVESDLAWRYAPGGPVLVAAVLDLLALHHFELPDRLHGIPLQIAGTMDNLRRRAYLLEACDPTTAERRGLHALVVELDTTTYPDQQVVHEVELEVPALAGAERAVEVLRECFRRAQVRWAPSTVSKRERLARVLRGERA